MKKAQLELKRTMGWGGRRAGAGRPRRGTEVNHLRREKIGPNVPVHVTMRLKPLSVSLRSKRLFDSFKRSARGARNQGLHINQFSLLGNHLHFIAEARDNACLASGMRSFAGRLGKHIRAAVGGRGAVFAGRYHLHALKTPTEYRRALAYVLLNRSKHAGVLPMADAYSSAVRFGDWGKLVHQSHVARLMRSRSSQSMTFLTAARSWLGRRGWWHGRLASD